MNECDLSGKATQWASFRLRAASLVNHNVGSLPESWSTLSNIVKIELAGCKNIGGGLAFTCLPHRFHYLLDFSLPQGPCPIGWVDSRISNFFTWAELVLRVSRGF